MTTTEEKHPNDKKKRGRLAKREIRIPITQDSNKNNEENLEMAKEEGWRTERMV